MVLVLPAACLAGFGQFQQGFTFFAHLLAFVPGLLGSYLRVAYYSMTLGGGCGDDCYIALGSYFSQPGGAIGDHVKIGAYCVIGKTNIGDRSLIASGVQILSGTAQHSRGADGRLTDQGRVFQLIEIGRDCWLGAGSLVMANVGAGANVAPGSVVLREVPAGVTVAGNPARVARAGQPEATAVG